MGRLTYGARLLRSWTEGNGSLVNHFLRCPYELPVTSLDRWAIRRMQCQVAH